MSEPTHKLISLLPTLSSDLIIFDEATQVRPAEATGALLRGGQLLVAGDTKQLPPTGFFDTLNDTVEDKENVATDLQRILSICDRRGALQYMLRWSYRSRRESMIRVCVSFNGGGCGLWPVPSLFKSWCHTINILE